MGKLISVIVPVYNAVKTLERCVDSILGCKNIDLEIILIDDGSQDNSLEICYELAKKDDRIVVFSHDNKGVSYTRNRGISNAKGQFILFVDSDDYLDATVLENSINGIDDYTDIVFTGYARIQKDKEIKIFPEIKEGNYCELSNEMLVKLMDTFILHNIGTKLYRTELLIRYKLYFNDNIANFEDVLFALRVLQKSTKIRITREILYYYVISSESLNHSYRENYYDGIMAYHNALINTNLEYSIIYGILFDNYIKLIMNYIKGRKKHKEIRELIVMLSSGRNMKEIISYINLDEIKTYKKILFLLMKHKKYNCAMLWLRVLSTLY